jgi:hypothetical protein
VIDEVVGRPSKKNASCQLLLYPFRGLHTQEVLFLVPNQISSFIIEISKAKEM